MAVQSSYASAPSVGLPGSLDGNGGDAPSILMRFNEEASAHIPFGVAVKEGTGARGALLPAAESNVIMGITVRSQSYSVGTEVDDDGMFPDVEMNILRKGRVWVTSPLGCTKGQRLWVRCTANSGAEFLGACEVADDGTETIDCTGQGMFLTAADAGELALLEVDFLNEI